MKNPFKFGSIVEGSYFTNRNNEIKEVKSILESENHLIIISPRRYGKTSLIYKVIKELKRSFIILDLQIITSQEDFAEELLKRIYRLYPFEKIKNAVKNFRIVPLITINPVSNEIDVSFKTTRSSSISIPLEDVLNLIEKLSSVENKLIVVFDEFQEVKRIGKELDKHLRSILQHHKKINYVFLGSQESLIRDIFEKKKSPFYHFGYLLPLEKIPYEEFKFFLRSRFKKITNDSSIIVDSIVKFTNCHPYYTQQLSFAVWEILERSGKQIAGIQAVETAEYVLIKRHDIDYERLWNTLNRTDMKILIGMSFSNLSPLSGEFAKIYNIPAHSTVFSSLKRLMMNGFIVKNKNSYEIDDPFFKKWIIERRLR